MKFSSFYNIYETGEFDAKQNLSEEDIQILNEVTRM